MEQETKTEQKEEMALTDLENPSVEALEEFFMENYGRISLSQAKTKALVPIEGVYSFGLFRLTKTFADFGNSLKQIRLKGTVQESGESEKKEIILNGSGFKPHRDGKGFFIMFYYDVNTINFKLDSVLHG